MLLIPLLCVLLVLGVQWETPPGHVLIAQVSGGRQAATSFWRGPRCTACWAARDVYSLSCRECLEQPCEASPVCVYMRDEVGARPHHPAPPPAPKSPCGPAPFSTLANSPSDPPEQRVGARL